MRMLNVVNGPQQVSVIVQGCMRMPAKYYQNKCSNNDDRFFPI